MDKDNILRAVHLLSDREKAHGALFHYTKTDVVRSILKPQNIDFRLTSIYKLQENDPYEGNSRDVFWQMAVKRLLDKGIISISEAYELYDVTDIPDSFIYSITGLNNSVAIKDQANAYIACFSSKREDPFMYANYAAGNGFGLAFDCRLMHEEYQTYDNGCKTKIIEILYGEDAVNYLEQYICKVLDICGGINSQDYKTIGHALVRDAYTKARYTLKTDKYRRENEVRLLALIPTDRPIEALPAEYTISDDGKYIYLPYHRYCYKGIDSAVRDESNEGVYQYLKDNSYHLGYYGQKNL